MAVVAGRDYAFSPHLRTVLKGAGPTRACALVTRRALYIMPYVSISGGGTTIVRTTVTVDGMEPAVYVGRLLSDPQMTPDQLDAVMAGHCQRVTGAVARPLDAFKRIKIRSGFFGRTVRLTVRPDGVWGNPLTDSFGWRPGKEDLPAFTALFTGDPRLV